MRSLFKKTNYFISILCLCGLTTVQAHDERSRQNDRDSHARHIGSQHGKAMTVNSSDSKSVADAIKDNFAARFGVTDPADLVVKKTTARSDFGQTIRYQQQYKGVDIIAGELVANVNAANQLLSISGETSKPVNVNTTPTVTAADAQQTALTAVAKWHGVDTSALIATGTALKVYDPKLVGPSNMGALLVWEMEIIPNELLPIREYMLIDAASGNIALHFNKIDTALNRNTYTANNTIALPGTLVCTEADPTCSAGDADAMAAHAYAADTYNFYSTRHGRDSLDNAGMTLISSVHHGAPGYQNALWNGTQMAYGDGFSLADDVVSHELTHGVTENSSNLLYYYQSGAINESFSDVWGEFVDLTNTGGTDTAGVRWQMGEDIPSIGAIRNMQNPTLFGDPDKMSSANYYTGTADSGGVHTNSGVNNKAAYLMADGDTFNGKTVTALGIDKTAKIYYEAQTNLLTSGSDYLDLYNALQQACQNLIGTGGITSGDCVQVKNAIDAVEMNLDPTASYNPEAAICAAGQTANNVFFDNMEGAANWTYSALTGSLAWNVSSGRATSGSNMLLGRNFTTTSDSVATLTSAVTVPANAFLHFRHAFDFENLNDGGVIEYSTNNGASWTDASSLIVAGKAYTGTLASGNPMAGRTAYTSISNGYVSSKLDLSSLVGQNLQVRFRVGSDSSVAGQFGWVVDDVRIYTCVTGGNLPPVANAGADQTVNQAVSVNLNGNASSDPNSDTLTFSWAQTGGSPTVALANANTATPSFIAPAGPVTLTFTLTVNDGNGGQNSDSVDVVVNGAPTANAGADQSVDHGATVSLNGAASTDPESGTLTYSWVQTSGTNSISLVNPTSATPSFTAPSSDDTIVVTLTVTDNLGASASDSVTITVAAAGSGGGGGSSGGCTVATNTSFDPAMLLLLLMLVVYRLRKTRIK